MLLCDSETLLDRTVLKVQNSEPDPVGHLETEEQVQKWPKDMNTSINTPNLKSA